MEQDIIRSLLAWYDSDRRSFAFRGTKDPYRIWLSEIMLQQTRTETVEAYYLRFLERFPTLAALAAAPEEAVLKAWEGLGYYSRARNLLRCARILQEELGGQFPRTAEELVRLPGIGPYTAAAVASIAFDQPVPAIDGNLSRVLSRLYCMTEDITSPGAKRRLYALGKGLMPPRRAGDMNQALMDLGARICLPGTPDCEACPVRPYCLAYEEGEPERLPLMPGRRPPKLLPYCVSLLFCGRKVWITQRQERLLQGLYVFHMKQTEDPHEVERALKLKPGSLKPLGQARHIFTHRVWEMQLFTAHIEAHQAPPGGMLVSLQELQALPLPTAMRKARELCVEMLRGEEEGHGQG